MMKNRIERLVVFPFTTGCVSSTSVAVCVQDGRRPKDQDLDSSHMACRSLEIRKDPKEEEGISTSNENTMKGSLRFLAISKPNVSIGFQKLTRSIKTLSQSLVFKEEIEEVQIEMEIGLPTDVKHVTHIGLDGSTTIGGTSCDNLINQDFFSFCPISLTQFEQLATPPEEMDDASHMQNTFSDAPYNTEKN